MKKDEEKAKLKKELAEEKRVTDRLNRLVVKYEDVINMAYDILDIREFSFYGGKPTNGLEQFAHILKYVITMKPVVGQTESACHVQRETIETLKYLMQVALKDEMRGDKVVISGSKKETFIGVESNQQNHD